MVKRKRVRKVTKLKPGDVLRVKTPKKGRVVVRGPEGTEVVVERQE